MSAGHAHRPQPPSADWLRRRFREDPPPATRSDPASGTPAAVLVPLVLRDDDLTVLLTQRTAHLTDHPGQIAFPGGRSEPYEDSPIATALREAQEEVGLAPERVEVLGLLPEYRTITGFCVSPVVALVHPPFDLALDAFEVAEVFETPLAFLLDARNHERHAIEVAGVLRHYYAMPWQGRFIWGATAGMIVSLARYLGGEGDAGPVGD